MASLILIALLALSAHGLHVAEVIPPAPFVVDFTARAPRAAYKTHLKRQLFQGTLPATNVAILGGADGDQEYLADITVGNQSFKVIVDTGSSDTWLAKEGFKCFNLTSFPLNSSACGFGSDGFDPAKSLTFEPYPDKNFNISYGDGEFLTGSVGFEQVTVGGLTVQHQEIGVVDAAAWSGDSVNTGLMGLAYPYITSVFNGTNVDADSNNNTAPYNPFFFTAIAEGVVSSPYFSVTLNRASLSRMENSSYDRPLGHLAFGGMAPVGVKKNAVTVPIRKSVMSSGKKIVYAFYNIDVDAYVYANSTAHHHNATGNSTTDGAAQAILDTGTTLNYVPSHVARAYNALWTPPARNDSGTFFVDCNATAPPFSVAIGGREFAVDPRDQILPAGTDDNGTQLCISGTQDGGAPNGNNTFILGDVFLHNVVATFHVSASDEAANRITLTERAPY